MKVLLFNLTIFVNFLDFLIFPSYKKVIRSVYKVILKFVGNKAKGRISKRVLQENKARQIFRKNEHF